jgi:glycosyltransferase involved in cell wall biosynthesis
MRVLLTSPYGWPDVRRGAERELHELASRLRQAGDDARVLTGTAQGVTRSGAVLGAPVRWVRTPRLPSWPEPGPGFGLAALVAARRADLVHCLHYADAWGATRSGRPVVLKLTGTVLPERVQGWDERLLLGALRRADEVWVNSDYAVRSMAGFGVPMRVVPAGLDTSVFAPVAARSDRPLVVCAAASDEPRKRVEDLLAAWPDVRRLLPGAELVLVGQGPLASAALPEGARHAGLLGDADLAALYSSAWAVAAPAVHEALGLVTLEALSCGTPVAGVASGATADLVDDGRTGALAEPLDPGSLAEAVVAAAGLAHDPGTAEACRAAAASYDWQVVVPQVREGHRRVLAAAAG